jgi:peptide deformylase
MVLKEGFIQADLDTGDIPEILTQKAQVYTFPLTAEELEELAQFEARYDPENDIVSFAGPQLNLPRSVIHFEAPKKYRQFRPDLTQTMPRTLWLNPSYEAIGDQKTSDYEACFSVKKYAAEVDRYSKIHYIAYDKEGRKIAGIAEGFLARVIQHEIDHVNGILFTSVANPGTRMTIEAYRELKLKRAEEAEKAGAL